MSPTDNELDGFLMRDDQSIDYDYCTDLEHALINLVKVIVREVPESQRYGIDELDLGDFFDEGIVILNRTGNGLHKYFLDAIRDYMEIDAKVEYAIQRAHWNEISLPRSLDEIVDDFFAEFESNGWNAYSHVEDKGKQGKHYLHIETIGISLVLYLKKNEYDVEDETPSYYIRYVETKNTSELPEWAQPKKDES